MITLLDCDWCKVQLVCLKVGDELQRMLGALAVGTVGRREECPTARTWALGDRAFFYVLGFGFSGSSMTELPPFARKLQARMLGWVLRAAQAVELSRPGQM